MELTGTLFVRTTLATLALLLFTGLFAQAPSLNWDETYYTGAGTNIGRRVILGPDTTVTVLGGDGFNNYVAQYRSYNGQLLWQTQWDSSTVAVDLVRAENGMFVAAWVYYNEPFNTPFDVGVSAFGSDGAPLWTYVYNDSLDREDIVRDLHVDADGNVLLCATTERVLGNSSFKTNITTIKLDASGNLLWRRTWNGPANDHDEPAAVWTDASNNVFVAGHTTSSGIAGQDLLLLKYDAAGDLQWSRIVNRNSGFGSHVDRATRVMTDAAGNAYVAGLTESPNADLGEDISVYAYDPDGGLLWPYHHDVQVEEDVLDMDMDPNGDLYVLGRFSSNSGNGETVLRLNANGSLAWASTYASNAIGPPFPNALALSPDGNVITTGIIGDQLLRDAYVHAYDSDGIALWTYRYVAENSNHKEEGHDVTVGPNRAIYVTGLFDQTGQSLTRGVTFCLCAEEESVCLLPVQTQEALWATDFVGADVDQDGWRDIVFGNFSPASLGVYLGSSGGFVLQSGVVLPFTPGHLAAGDLDQDGDDDFAVLRNGEAELGIVLDENGTLQYASTINTGADPRHLVIADFDGQNGNDIAVATNAAQSLLILLNNGGGSFTASNPIGISNAWELDVADGDGDGELDLLVGRPILDSVYFLHGNGNGTFAAPMELYVGITVPALVRFGDFDQDGTTDIVSASNSGSYSVRRGLGGGVFAAPLTGNSGGEIHDLLVTPFAADTNMKLVIGGNVDTRSLNYSNCTMQYAPVTWRTTPPGTHLLDLGDWSNDGTLDLLSYEISSAEIQLWRDCDTTGISLSVPSLDAVPNDALTVFPSPSSRSVSIVRPSSASGIADISVWSLQGRCIHRITTTSMSERIDVAEWADGPYLVRYNTQNGVWTTRLIKAASER